MKIVKYFGITKQELDQKKFNIWIGISLRSKHFNKENIEKYIIFSLEHTKKDVLVVIADLIEAININILDKYNRSRALKVALRKGDNKEREVREIIAKLPKEKQKLIKIIHWKDITNTKIYKYQLESFFDEFSKKDLFYKKLIELTQKRWEKGPHRLDINRLEKLAEYYMYEIPLFLNGIKYNNLTEKQDKKYLLQLYPKLDEFDNFLVDLAEGKSFPEITKKLKIKHKFATLELR